MTTAVFTCRMQIREKKRKPGCISTWSAMKAGEIKKVNAVDAKEILEELALCDAQKDE